MHPALTLPEIVAGILQTCTLHSISPHDLDLLRPCLYVNRLFSLEATRILWGKCGSGFEHRPRIAHLATLVVNDLFRAQYYANFIRELRFGVEGTWPDDEWPNNVSRDEARFHDVLRHLQFPRLEAIELDGSPYSRSLNTTSSLSHYFQGSLKKFTIYEGGLSDNLFETLTSMNPGLEVLTIMLDDDSDSEEEEEVEEGEGVSKDDRPADAISEAALIEFLESMPALSNFSIDPTLKGVWTCKLFQVLARHPSLIDLSIPSLSEDFVGELSNLQSCNLFPSLRSITTRVSDRSLELLLYYAPHLSYLNLGFWSLSSSALPIISRHLGSNLISLSIDFIEGSSIDGADLTTLAKYCPNLVALELPSRFNFAGSDKVAFGKEINDWVISEMTAYLPNLRTFFLSIRQCSLLTHASLLSIGKNCKQLEFCGLSADIHLDQLVQNLDITTFPELTSLSVVFDQNHTHIYDNPSGLAEHFVNLVPKLNNLSFQYEGISGHDFSNNVCSLITNRSPQIASEPESQLGVISWIA